MYAKRAMRKGNLLDYLKRETRIAMLLLGTIRISLIGSEPLGLINRLLNLPS